MAIVKELQQAGIDSELSEKILQNLRSGGLGQDYSTACDDFEIPTVDGQDIVDFSAGLCYQVRLQRIQELLDLYPELRSSCLANLVKSNCSATNSVVKLSEEQIDEVGLLLSPYFAFGVLNGGSASSYFDRKKNQGFSPELFDLFHSEFNSLAHEFAKLPKALCPAFLKADGSYGPTFMGLKLRALLYTIKKQRQLRCRYGFNAPAIEPKFLQMTSQLTHEPLQEYIAHNWQYDRLQEWVTELNWLPEQHIFSELQPLLSTFSYHEGDWQFFRGKNGQFLPMPGGHGQCFVALRKRLEIFYNQGIRYVSLGNIDNVAYNPQPGFIGLLALSGRDSFFVCSYRSSVDIKGGVLLRPKQNKTCEKLNCFDVGVGVDKDIFQVAKQEGKELLFNCAIGYFDLGALLKQIDRIIDKLPLRVSEQNKDQGHYWQVEQITWEVIGLMDSVLIGAVCKEEHFLAAKLQLEALVNTGYRIEHYRNCGLEDSALLNYTNIARRFASGYAKVMQRDCKLSM